MRWLLLSTEGPAGRGGRLSSPVSRRARAAGSRRPAPVPTPFTGDACAAHMATEVTVRGLPQGPSVSAVQTAVRAELARRG